MKKLALPFWAVRAPLQNEHFWPPDQALAFSSTDRLKAYLSGRRVGRPKYSLVADDLDLLMLVADLHQEKLSALCMDPDTDGSGGQQIPLSQVLGQLD